MRRKKKPPRPWPAPPPSSRPQASSQSLQSRRLRSHIIPGYLEPIFGIPVFLEIDSDEDVVTDDIIGMYGVGKSIPEAIEDYKSFTKQYFEFLQARKGKLGGDMERHLAYLRSRPAFMAWIGSSSRRQHTNSVKKLGAQREFFEIRLPTHTRTSNPFLKKKED